MVVGQHEGMLLSPYASPEASKAKLDSDNQKWILSEKCLGRELIIQ